MYDYRQSKKVLEEILTSQTKVIEKEKIPASDIEFTYKNGIKTWVGAVFIDIVNSSELCKTPDENTARILRAFCSETISILRDNPNYREIGIRGDCVYCIYTTQYQSDLEEIFVQAYRINTFMIMFNKLLKKHGFDGIRAGIGLGCDNELIVKAGQSGSGISDKIWIGNAVIDACRLGDIANRNGVSPIAMSPVFYNNIKDLLEKKNPNYSVWIKQGGSLFTDSYYHCDIIETDFNNWIEGGME